VPGVDLGGEAAASAIETVRGSGYRVRDAGGGADRAVRGLTMMPAA
jgi:hypothetical protein